MRKLTKRAAVIATGAVIAVTGSTAAFAYAAGWFKGDGTAAATTAEIKNVHAAITVSGHIYPGLSVPIVASQIDNPNDYPVQINGISVASVTDPSGAGCDQSKAGFSFDGLPSGTKVAKGFSAQNVALGNIVMSATADPVCAGRALTVNLTLAGEITTA
jgi:hypothetical protein